MAQQNWDMWMQHQNEHDYHTEVSWHLEKLKENNFKIVDILWKNVMWAVIYAQK